MARKTKQEKEIAKDTPTNHFVVSYKNIEAGLKQARASIKAVKEQVNYSSLLDQKKKIAYELYKFMSDNGLEELDGVKLSTVMPPDEKKEIKRNLKLDKISEVLRTSLPEDEDFEELADKLVDL